jgi:hypothetical protein
MVIDLVILKKKKLKAKFLGEGQNQKQTDSGFRNYSHHIPEWMDMDSVENRIFRKL